jgi:hypothetical protein
MILINHISNKTPHQLIINAKGTISYNVLIKVLLFLSITSNVLCDAALGSERIIKLDRPDKHHGFFGGSTDFDQPHGPHLH